MQNIVFLSRLKVTCPSLGDLLWAAPQPHQPLAVLDFEKPMRFPLFRESFLADEAGC